MKQPVLETVRLFLRPFKMADAPVVQKLAGEKEIASNTLKIPHPYEDGMAEAWIGTHPELFKQDKECNFAIINKSDGQLVGAIGLMLKLEHHLAEVGYWIGKPYWNRGYGTEAARGIVRYGFEELQLNRIEAYFMSHNPASGKILEKIGMKYEGCSRQKVFKWGEYVDVNCYAILKEDYQPDTIYKET